MFVVLFEDSAAFAGILLSQLTGLAQFDAIASIIIGLILGGTAVWLAVETQSLLIGESAGAETWSRVFDVLPVSATVWNASTRC